MNALNLYIINFPAASAQIPTESVTFLDNAAVAMKAAPVGTIIDDDEVDPAVPKLTFFGIV